MCAVGVAALALWPITATARPEHAGAAAVAGAAAAGGTVLGGVTSQDFPIVLETNKNARKVMKATIAIRLTCTSNSTVTLTDRYVRLTVSKSRKFGASFGPETSPNSDGTTTDFEGAISGKFNKARTKATGRWSFKATDHDASGAVTDTCDSGSVSWSAKQ